MRYSHCKSVTSLCLYFHESKQQTGDLWGEKVMEITNNRLRSVKTLRILRL